MEDFNAHKWFKKQYLKEDYLDEIRSPQTDFTRSQLVPRMEGMVNKETYKRFIDSLDKALLTILFLLSGLKPNTLFSLPFFSK